MLLHWAGERETVRPKIGLQGEWRYGWGKHGRQGPRACRSSPTAGALTCSQNNQIMKREVPTFLDRGRTGLNVKTEGIFSRVHLVAPLEVEGKDGHHRSCVFCWPPGGSMARLSETSQFFGNPKASDSEQFSGPLMPWGWLMVLPACCTPRVIEPAVFWRLQRDFLSLCLIEGAATCWMLYPFEYSLEAFLFAPRKCSLWQNVLKGGKDHWHPKIWATCLNFFRCLVCYAFLILFPSLILR